MATILDYNHVLCMASEEEKREKFQINSQLTKFN